MNQYSFDAAFGGARRDEEGSRAKERVFSFRDRKHRWDPKSQRPELWNVYNGRVHKGESIRVFPLSNWTELDVWQYIYSEDIPMVPLFFAAERTVVERDGMLMMVHDEQRFPVRGRRKAREADGALQDPRLLAADRGGEVNATTLLEVIEETIAVRHSERHGGAIDKDPGASMEQKKIEGYF
ncbi:MULTISPECIES: sulfate adenylyltransferase subunit CysD [unclassified Wenzhouxiangella]|uniref:sulfate adenylyltransferase subunit CysD n=1 Tax=unclassified Wenzhouxiangella TaxID=2613841 RepID=UPI002162B6F6|nr:MULTISPECIES: sulfate adenylyltransferase subunit CysD [unclassified Wenzhouxiangella]